MAENKKFRPDWISAPGDTIADLLEKRSLTQYDLTRQLDCSIKDINDLIDGELEITQEIARKLEMILGVSAKFWLVRERQYRNDLESLKRGEQFLKNLPIKDMLDYGWISPSSSREELLTNCLEFFNVPDVKTWLTKYRDVIETAAFRTSPTFKSRTESTAAWLRQGEIIAEQMDCAEWNIHKFAESLQDMRSLTRQDDPAIFLKRLEEICAKCGIAVVALKTPSGCRASGVTRFIAPNKVMLLLSFRYLSDDHFWFTFFHEAGHILLHNETPFFLDEDGTSHSSKDEKEADTFSANLLIPPEFKPDLFKLGLNGRDVMRFARRIGISPGIVVGQMQHLGIIRRNQLNNLKRRYTW